MMTSTTSATDSRKAAPSLTLVLDDVPLLVLVGVGILLLVALCDGAGVLEGVLVDVDAAVMELVALMLPVPVPDEEGVPVTLALMLAVALTDPVGDRVPDGVPERDSEIDTVGVPVAAAVLDGVPVTGGVTLPLRVAVALILPVPLRDTVGVPVLAAVPLGDDVVAGVPGGVPLDEPLLLGVWERVDVPVGEGSRVSEDVAVADQDLLVVGEALTLRVLDAVLVGVGLQRGRNGGGNTRDTELKHEHDGEMGKRGHECNGEKQL